MLVSIIMPYFKKKKYVKYSVLSVLNQTFKNFELIIIYDNETSDELKFINKIKKLDKRIKVIKNKLILVQVYLEILGLITRKVSI